MRRTVNIGLNLFKLNWQVFRLALQGRWLSQADYASSYDRIAADYDACWLSHLKTVTDSFLLKIPKVHYDHIIELGCGTGHITKYLVSTFPHTNVTAVDISANMQSEAGKKVASKNVTFVREDMLEFLARTSSDSSSLIVSGWAIGYSNPSRIISESSRVLSQGGVLAFVVNYKDTLKPVFDAFRKCMLRYPTSVRRAVIPRFPATYHSIEKILTRNGFEVVWHEEGFLAIDPPKGENVCREWLMKTGILAGFDSMLPLTGEGPVAKYFDKLLSESHEQIAHHYLSIIAKLK